MAACFGDGSSDGSAFSGRWDQPQVRPRKTAPARSATPPRGQAAAAKIESFSDNFNDVYANSHEVTGALSREVLFRDWGEISWQASFPGLADLERAERLTGLLMEDDDDRVLSDGVVRVVVPAGWEVGRPDRAGETEFPNDTTFAWAADTSIED